MKCGVQGIRNLGYVLRACLLRACLLCTAFAALIVSGVACAPSSEVVLTATIASLPTSTPLATHTSVPTDTPQHTATPTRVPLSELDLEPLLIVPGDLPAGFSGAQIRDVLPPMFDGVPETDNQISQQFERDGEGAGSVNVMLYSAGVDREAVYARILDGFAEPEDGSNIKVVRENIAEVGEMAEAETIEASVLSTPLNTADLTFVRCGAVVHIRLFGTSKMVDIVSYARRLDRRLMAVVCR